MQLNLMRGGFVCVSGEQLCVFGEPESSKIIKKQFLEIRGPTILIFKGPGTNSIDF